MKRVFILIITCLLAAMTLTETGCSNRSTNGEATGDSIKMTKEDSLSPAKWLASLSHQISMNPNNYALYNDRSEVYLRLDSLKAAIQDVEKALKINDSISETYYLRGYYACLDKDTAKAVESLEKAMTLGTINSEVPYQLGQIAFMQKNYVKADDLSSNFGILF